jgi:hypothetical protein
MYRQRATDRPAMARQPFSGLLRLSVTVAPEHNASPDVSGINLV